MIDEKYLTEIEELHDGDWIVWVGGENRPSWFSSSGQMDFILDGKPHKVNKGRKDIASFYGSPSPNCEWAWGPESMRKVDTKAILKGLME